LGCPPTSQSAMPDGSQPPRLRGVLLALALLTGCTPPVLRQAQPAELQVEWLAFLVVGKTTREEVLLKLGTPSAHLEGERILTYVFARRVSGSWEREPRTMSPGQKLPLYRDHRVGNLVLVFAPDGRLARHSLVGSE